MKRLLPFQRGSVLWFLEFASLFIFGCISFKISFYSLQNEIIFIKSKYLYFGVSFFFFFYLKICYACATFLIGMIWMQKITTYIVSILADTYFHILKTLQVKTLCIYRMERKWTNEYKTMINDNDFWNVFKFINL